MASSVQGVSCIRKNECRDVLSGYWSATRSCSMRFLKMSDKRRLVQLSLFTTYCFNFLISLFCEISSSPHNVDYYIHNVLIFFSGNNRKCFRIFNDYVICHRICLYYILKGFNAYWNFQINLFYSILFYVTYVKHVTERLCGKLHNVP